ncbi:MAG TPA: ABC transporter permease [Mycobacteriales bacterium]|jgi:ABC-type transport system involved in multi-copper enzyme maturation permease subunit|nr:ABC transporter permease [Mycobacteriales bacterium]
MTRLIHTELLKLRTTRVTYALLATALSVTALFTALSATVGQSTARPIAGIAGQAAVTTTSGFAMIIAALLGALAATGEFRHSSATLTFLAIPDRPQVLAAKAAAGAAVGAGFGLLAALTTTAIGLGVIVGKGDHVRIGAGALVGHVAGAALGAALLAAIGVAIGMLVRSQLATVIGVFVWCLVVESILGDLVHAVRPYLPYTAATTLGGTRLGSAAFGPGYEIGTQPALPFIATAALLLAGAVAVAFLAARTTLRRDVT